MRRIRLFIIMMLFFITLGGCSKNKQNTGDVTATPSPEPIVTLTPTKVANEDTSGTDADQNTDTRKLLEYFQIQADTEYIYEGKGNEYASYTRFTDFVDEAENKVQIRSNNGGTETVDVIQIKDGKVSVIYTAHECYYRDSFMDKTEVENKTEVLLMEPLAVGTKWTLSDGSTRSITALDTDIDTPSGKYKAIEVTTKSKGSITRDYYAPKAGLVKTIFGKGNEAITSTLSKIKTDTPFTQKIDVYYPNIDEKINTKPLTLSFHTNDVTRLVLQEALRKEAVKESDVRLVSDNTKINTLYLGDDDIVYVDFSSDLVKDMNAGSGYEALILQCITNTLGNYYGVERVYITIDRKPYESGHILMKKGETFKVNMDKVVR